MEVKIFRKREKDYALERIRVLEKKYPEASEILNFYQHILQYQKEVYISLENKDISWHKNIKWFYKLADLCIKYGTLPLSQKANELKSLERGQLESRIINFLKEKEADDTERFLFISFLKPFYEHIAEQKEVDKVNWFKSRCPVCGFKPSVSYIADAEEVEGGRFLQCVLCSTEWLYNRNRCVNCGNEDDKAIDYYCVGEKGSVQLQVCQKCGYYIKLIDMRLDGFAIPYLEDIASLTLDLWAKEKGFIKFERNVFGL
ncbi:MAG: formate dehydrogenase accessory protein FdhE [Aquificaceae bacterium]